MSLSCEIESQNGQLVLSVCGRLSRLDELCRMTWVMLGRLGR